MRWQVPQSSELNLRTVGTALPLVVVSVAYHSQGPLTSLAVDLGRQQNAPLAWLVVDNAPLSAPLDPLPLQAQLGAVPLQLLRGQQGSGFAAGCNAAFAALQRQGHRGWVWLLNPDIHLPEIGLVEQVCEALQALEPRTLVGTAVRDEAGGLEASGGWLDSGLRFRRRRLMPEDAMAAEALAVDWLSGCSLLLQPTAHQPPARFDPAYPLYYEDMDLCLRLAAAGAPVLWLPQLQVLHQRGEGSRTPSARRLQLSTRSYCRFLQQHCPPWVRLLRLSRLLVGALLRAPLQPQRALAVWRGFRGVD